MVIKDLRLDYRSEGWVKRNGGARSLQRTALSLHFPANSEFNSEICSF
jgi:hypothetical protein